MYGSAADIPALLDDAAAATDWDAPVWRELWQRLCHQGSVAPASYAALPALARIAESRADLALDPALFLAASIIASRGGPPEISDVRSVYAVQITALRPVAEYKLELVTERADVLYALEVVAAFEDLSIWQRDLDRLVNDEVELDCPSCGHHINRGLVNGALVATADPDAVGDGLPVQPADPGSWAQRKRACSRSAEGTTTKRSHGNSCSCSLRSLALAAVRASPSPTPWRSRSGRRLAGQRRVGDGWAAESAEPSHWGRLSRVLPQFRVAAWGFVRTPQAGVGGSNPLRRTASMQVSGLLTVCLDT